MLRLYENGKTLKELRQESGLKLYRVAELMNVSISRVKDIEKADNLTYRVITEYLSAIGYLIKADSLTADFLAKKGE